MHRIYHKMWGLNTYEVRGLLGLFCVICWVNGDGYKFIGWADFSLVWGHWAGRCEKCVCTCVCMLSVTLNQEPTLWQQLKLEAEIETLNCFGHHNPKHSCISLFINHQATNQPTKHEQLHRRFSSLQIVQQEVSILSFIFLMLFCADLDSVCSGCC